MKNLKPVSFTVNFIDLFYVGNITKLIDSQSCNIPKNSGK